MSIGAMITGMLRWRAREWYIDSFKVLLLEGYLKRKMGGGVMGFDKKVILTMSV